MDDKQTLLNTISTALETGKITKNDLLQVIGRHSAEDTADTPASKRLSAVDVMFYIAGIVLFAAIAAIIGQAWDGGPSVRILLSAGMGALFWTAALYFILTQGTSDIRRGITNSLLLAGSFSLIVGGFIIANEYFDFDSLNYFAAAFTFAILGALHISFGWQIKRDILLLIGIVLAVATFPVLVFGLLDDSGLPMFVNCLVVAVTGGLLVYTARAVAHLGATNDSSFGRALDPIGAFTVLMSLYVASYDEGTGLLWLLVLVLGIVGLFYLSIVVQNKLLLGYGSFFLVLSIITISYRYFSDNVAISLLISALGLFGTAIMAATINRRYIN